MKTQSYEMEGLTQSNAVLTNSKSAVMAQLSHMTVTMNAIQAQLKALASAQTNQSNPKRKHYFWSCGRKSTHRIKNCLSKRAEHKDDAYYRKMLSSSEKGCE